MSVWKGYLVDNVFLAVLRILSLSDQENWHLFVFLICIYWLWSYGPIERLWFFSVGVFHIVVLVWKLKHLKVLDITLWSILLVSLLCNSLLKVKSEMKIITMFDDEPNKVWGRGTPYVFWRRFLIDNILFCFIILFVIPFQVKPVELHHTSLTFVSIEPHLMHHSCIRIYKVQVIILPVNIAHFEVKFIAFDSVYFLDLSLHKGVEVIKGDEGFVERIVLTVDSNDIFKNKRTILIISTQIIIPLYRYSKNAYDFFWFILRKRSSFDFISFERRLTWSLNIQWISILMICLY